MAFSKGENVAKYIYILIFSITIFFGCSNQKLSHSEAMPYAEDKKIALYPLANYTETPRAGMRAANILEGVLLSKGYKVDNRLTDKTRKLSLDRKIADARRRGDRYALVGGVSEWRYKTGIDGEPAISVFIKLIDTSNKNVVWSATGSDNDWGNESVGTVAQRLFESMIEPQ
jgi:TolB-like protein